MSDLTEFLVDLINIPSWVDEDCPEKYNENALVNYLSEWVKKNTNLKVEKQLLPGGRFNLICKNGSPEVLFLGHTDTVAPSGSSDLGKCKGIVQGAKIYGRGACDMKSGIASMLMAIKNNPSAKNFWICLYADEEYSFLGMKNFINSYKDIRPKYIISADGSDLKLKNGCRGLIEIKIRLIGKTGHAARGNGLNAITGLFGGYKEVENKLKTFNQSGESSINLAYLLGGANLGQGVGQAGNVIPDIATAVIDIRPVSPEIQAIKIINWLKNYYVNSGYVLEVLDIKHDLSAWCTDKKAFCGLIDCNGQTWEKINEGGYYDLQMAWSNMGYPPAIVFGGGDGKTAHGPDESIQIESLQKVFVFFDKILKKL